MNQLTQEEIKNLISLVSVAPIKGGESVVVALLLQKLSKMLEPEVTEEPKKK